MLAANSVYNLQGYSLNMANEMANERDMLHAAIGSNNADTIPRTGVTLCAAFLLNQFRLAFSGSTAPRSPGNP